MLCPRGVVLMMACTKYSSPARGPLTGTRALYTSLGVPVSPCLSPLHHLHTGGSTRWYDPQRPQVHARGQI